MSLSTVATNLLTGFLVLVLLWGIATPFRARTERSWERRGRLGAGLLGLVIGLLGLTFGFLTDTASLWVTACFAGLLVVPRTELVGGEEPSPIEATATATTSLLVALLLGVFLTLHPPIADATSLGAPLPLLALGFAAIIALLSFCIASATLFLGRSPIPLLLLSAASFGALWMSGLLRSNSLEDRFIPRYFLPLATSHPNSPGEPIFWVLDSLPTLPDGLRYQVTQALPLMEVWITGVLVISLLLMVVSLWSYRQGEIAFSRISPGVQSTLQKVYLIGLLVGLAGAVAILLGIAFPGTLTLPKSEFFVDLSMRVVSASSRGLETLTGSFRSATNHPVEPGAELAIAHSFLWMDWVLASLGTLSLTILLADAFLALKRGGWGGGGGRGEGAEESEERLRCLYGSATLLARGTLASAVLVISAALFHTVFYGVPWLASPSEWLGIGMVAAFAATTLLVSGLLVQGNLQSGRTSNRKPLAVGLDWVLILAISILSALVLWLLAWSVSYHSLIGFSLQLFP